jgi:hypothetical protein
MEPMPPPGSPPPNEPIPCEVEAPVTLDPAPEPEPEIPLDSAGE